MQHVIKHVFLSVILLIVASTTVYANNSNVQVTRIPWQTSGYQATDSYWNEPPLSCLPWRAGKWTSESDKPLCHCPPASMCPSSVADWNASPIVPPYMLTACCNISCPRGTVADIDPCGRTETVNTGSEGQGADPNAPTQAERVAARMNTNIQKALAEGVMSVANECQSCQDTEGPEEGDPKDVDPIGCEGLSGCEVTPQDAYTICIPTLSCTPISENPCDKVTDLTDPHRDPSLQATTDISCTVAEAFCILEGTEIVLVDGSKKNIEDIKLGDKLRSGAKNVVMVEAVSKVIRKKGALHSINGSRAFITAEHPIMTTKGWKAIAPNSDLDHSIKILGALEVGDVIVTADGTETVKTIEAKDLESDAGVATYNLIVNGDGTFVADGVVVKSMRKSAIYY